MSGIPWPVLPIYSPHLHQMIAAAYLRITRLHSTSLLLVPSTIHLLSFLVSLPATILFL
jgi:hypothetical protein